VQGVLLNNMSKLTTDLSKNTPIILHVKLLKIYLLYNLPLSRKIINKIDNNNVMMLLNKHSVVYQINMTHKCINSSTVNTVDTLVGHIHLIYY